MLEPAGLGALRRLRPADRPRRRLLTIGGAGCGASVCEPLARATPTRVEVLGARLPGREDRWREPALHSVEKMAQGIIDSLRMLAPLPLTVFGHSFGAAVAFETARLAQQNTPMVERLVVACAPAPSVAPRPPGPLDDVSLLHAIRVYGAVPEPVLRNDEYMSLVLPAFRGDLIAMSAYAPQCGLKVDCPIIAAAASADTTVAREDVARWEERTTSTFSLIDLAGGHFAPFACPEAIISLIGMLPITSHDVGIATMARGVDVHRVGARKSIGLDWRRS